ncbi:MAG: hypothetical protein R2748_22250 [Bryobacterales bacterium]
MLRTVVNVTGDLSCAAFVARSEGEMLEPAIQASGDRREAVSEVQPGNAIRPWSA